MNACAVVNSLLDILVYSNYNTLMRGGDSGATVLPPGPGTFDAPHEVPDSLRPLASASGMTGWCGMTGVEDGCGDRQAGPVAHARLRCNKASQKRE